MVLAAGPSTRFGGRKQLALLHGRQLLECAIAATKASATDATFVVLGAYAEDVEAGVDLSGSEVVRCPDWHAGRGASLRAALARLPPEADAALVTLGDEPLIAPAASDRLILARRPGVPALRAAYSGRPGHPVLIECELFEPLIETLKDSASPAAILREAGIRSVNCDDLGPVADVDTVEQLADLAKQHPCCRDEVNAPGA